MYIIKQRPEEFVVKEEIELQLDESGEYAYFWLRKKGHNTVAAVEKIARFVHCRPRDVGFAGAKDKQAVSTQAVSIRDKAKRIRPDRFDRFNSEQISVDYIGRGRKPISMGDLSGNSFEILIRECSAEPKAIDKMVNYFDDQRFSETNHEVGRAIVKKEFKKACSLISDDRVTEALKERPTDFIGAMKQLPLKIRMMHIHAYQSWLWNRTVAKILGDSDKKISYSLGELPIADVENRKVPVIGFGTEPDGVTAEILKEEDITPRDFVISSMREISAEGGERDMVVPVTDLTIEKKGEKDFLVKFKLQKGSYATMVVKQMME